MPHFFFLGKRKLSPYRACGVVGAEPHSAKRKKRDGKAMGKEEIWEKTCPMRSDLIKLS